MAEYGFRTELDMPFEEAVHFVTTELKRAGFGVISTIDLQDKFREKLGVAMDSYVILGTCKPGSAYKALQAEEMIGLMLPCNVIVFEKHGRTVVGAIRPTVAMEMIDNRDLQRIAEGIESELQGVLAKLGETVDRT